MTEERTIIHVDMDAFYAAVEQHDHPEFRGKPVIVGSPPNRRGVVSTCSYEARKSGVHSGMASVEAGRRCPHGIFVPVNMKRYADVSRQLFGIFERFSPFIEPLSVDEAFIDISGSAHLFGGVMPTVHAIKAAVKAETGLTCSVGVAHNKFLAKLASDLKKPAGITVVPKNCVAFLAPLPVQRIWGVGKTMEKQLVASGITTIEALQCISVSSLTTVIGEHAAQRLKKLAIGEDTRLLEMDSEEQSMSREITFDHDETNPEVVHNALLMLVDFVAFRLRRAGKYAGGIQLKLRWSGFQTITRQRSFDHAVHDVFSLMDEAKILFDRIPLTKPVRLVGFGVHKLVHEPAIQMDLFADVTHAEKREQISKAIDMIRHKYGQNSIRVGWNNADSAH